MENYKNQAIEMLGTFDEFPKDERRMNKILKMLKNGEKPMPIYVEKDDPHNFIMEGRHRIVAFYLMGFKDVEVARCSLKIENNIINVAMTCIPNITGHEITFLSFSIYVPLYFTKFDI